MLILLVTIICSDLSHCAWIKPRQKEVLSYLKPIKSTCLPQCGTWAQPMTKTRSFDAIARKLSQSSLYHLGWGTKSKVGQRRNRAGDPTFDASDAWDLHPFLFCQWKPVLQILCSTWTMWMFCVLWWFAFPDTSHDVNVIQLKIRLSRQPWSCLHYLVCWVLAQLYTLMEAKREGG